MVTLRKRLSIEGGLQRRADFPCYNDTPWTDTAGRDDDDDHRW
jgi:hypothetical protein